MTVSSSLMYDTAKTLVHAFISSCLDYCNRLLYGVSEGMLKKLQAVQNAAARVVTASAWCGRKFDHIMPVLRELHWLPIRQRTTYKLVMTVYKCLHRLAPTYFADDCLAISAIAGKRHLRSAGTGLLSLPRTRTTSGMRSFAVAGPVIWNSLLYQPPCEAAIRNSLPIDVRSTSEGPPVRLIDSASEDHLWRALQIYSSSSSWYLWDKFLYLATMAVICSKYWGPERLTGQCPNVEGCHYKLHLQNNKS